MTEDYGTVKDLYWWRNKVLQNEAIGTIILLRVEHAFLRQPVLTCDMWVSPDPAAAASRLLMRFSILFAVHCYQHLPTFYHTIISLKCVLVSSSPYKTHALWITHAQEHSRVRSVPYLLRLNIFRECTGVWITKPGKYIPWLCHVRHEETSCNTQEALVWVLHR